MRRVSFTSSWKKKLHICWWESTMGVKLALPELITPNSPEAKALPVTRASCLRKLSPVSTELKLNPPGPGDPFWSY
jgi:hypothetical protein